QCFLSGPGPLGGHQTVLSPQVLLVPPIPPQRLLDRTDLDRAEAGRRPARGDLERFLTITGLDHEEAADELLRLGERTVRHQPPPLAHPHRRGPAPALQPVGDDPMAPRPPPLARAP